MCYLADAAGDWDEGDDDDDDDNDDDDVATSPQSRPISPISEGPAATKDFKATAYGRINTLC